MYTNENTGRVKYYNLLKSIPKMSDGTEKSSDLSIYRYSVKKHSNFRAFFEKEKTEMLPMPILYM